LLQGAVILNAPAHLVIADCMPGELVYCDPPYLGTFTSYNSQKYGIEDYRELARLAKFKRGVRFLISSSDHEGIREVFSQEVFAGVKIHEIEERRSISCKGESRGKVNELVIEVAE
jgi:DNA adenine methylase